MSSEAQENKAIARRFLEETMAKGNLDVIDELVAPDFVDRSLMPGQGPTREDLKRSVAQILADFCTTSFTIEQQVAEGGTVVTKFRHIGVWRVGFEGAPPTGEEEVSASTASPQARLPRSGAWLILVRYRSISTT